MYTSLRANHVFDSNILRIQKSLIKIGQLWFRYWVFFTNTTATFVVCFWDLKDSLEPEYQTYSNNILQ